MREFIRFNFICWQTTTFIYILCAWDDGRCAISINWWRWCRGDRQFDAHIDTLGTTQSILHVTFVACWFHLWSNGNSECTQNEPSNELRTLAHQHKNSIQFRLARHALTGDWWMTNTRILQRILSALSHRALAWTFSIIYTGEKTNI